MKNCEHGRTIDKCNICIIDNLTYRINVLEKQNGRYEEQLDQCWEDIEMWRAAATKAEAALTRLLNDRDKIIIALQNLEIPKQPSPGSTRL